MVSIVHPLTREDNPAIYLMRGMDGVVFETPETVRFYVDQDMPDEDRFTVLSDKFDSDVGRAMGVIFL